MTCRRYLFFLLNFLLLGLVCPQIHAVAWFPFGPNGGDARSFAADPRDHNHLYLGAANGWVYQSRDGGKSWFRLASVGKRDDLVLDNILVDPANSAHLLVGALVPADLHHPASGLFVSYDSGATWISQPELRGQAVLALTIAPSDAKVMVAGSIDGVFRSNDSGAHWKQISAKGDKELHEVESLAIDPVDPNTIYAGTWHLPWKTIDGGATWKNVKQGIIEDSDVFSIIVDPKERNTVYLSACSGIYKREDGGVKFTGGVGQNKVQGIPSTARRTRVLMQDPNHPLTVFAGTTEGLYRTGDGGKHWVQTTGSDVIVNDVYVDPSDSNRVLLATDRGGVLLSDDGGASFVESNSGFSSRQITAYTGDVRHPATLYVGLINDKQWGGVFMSLTGGLSWSQISGGLDGSDVFSLGQSPDGTIIAGTRHGIYRLKDSLWQRVGFGGSGPVAAKAPVSKAPASRLKAKARPVATKARIAPAVNLSNLDRSVNGFALSGETLYAATSGGLIRSASSGLTWTAVAGVPEDEYRFVSSAKSNVVAGTLNTIQVSADGGSTWHSVSMPPKVTQLSALSVDGQGGLWAAGREGVYISNDKGGSWRTLPGLDVRNSQSIFYDDAKNRMLIASGGGATDVFAVALATMQVTSWDTGWNLRFVRPVGDHLIAGTLFDGIVVQPRMVVSGEPGPATAQR